MIVRNCASKTEKKNKLVSVENNKIAVMKEPRNYDKYFKAKTEK